MKQKKTTFVQRSVAVTLIASVMLTASACGLIAEDAEAGAGSSIYEEEVDEFYYEYINPISAATIDYVQKTGDGETNEAVYALSDTGVYTLKASCLWVGAEAIPYDSQPAEASTNDSITVICADDEENIVALFTWNGSQCTFYTGDDLTDVYLMSSETLDYIMAQLAEEIGERSEESAAINSVLGE